MAEVTLDFIAEQLVRLLDGQREIRHELGDVKQRLQAVEVGLLDVRRDIVRLDHRLDRVEDRLLRIERRLDLAEA